MSLRYVFLSYLLCALLFAVKVQASNPSTSDDIHTLKFSAKTKAKSTVKTYGLHYSLSLTPMQESDWGWGGGTTKKFTRIISDMHWGVFTEREEVEIISIGEVSTDLNLGLYCRGIKKLETKGVVLFEGHFEEGETLGVEMLCYITHHKGIAPTLTVTYRKTKGDNETSHKEKPIPFARKKSMKSEESKES